MVRKLKLKDKREKKDVELDYSGLHPDLLDYRYMDIEMNKWAATDSGCMSIAGIAVLGFLCAGSILLPNLFWGG